MVCIADSVLILFGNHVTHPSHTSENIVPDTHKKYSSEVFHACKFMKWGIISLSSPAQTANNEWLIEHKTCPENREVIIN